MLYCTYNNFEDEASTWETGNVHSTYSIVCTVHEGETIFDVCIDYVEIGDRMNSRKKYAIGCWKLLTSTARIDGVEVRTS